MSVQVICQDTTSFSQITGSRGRTHFLQFIIPPFEKGNNMTHNVGKSLKSLIFKNLSGRIWIFSPKKLKIKSWWDIFEGFSSSVTIKNGVDYGVYWVLSLWGGKSSELSFDKKRNIIKINLSVRKWLQIIVWRLTWNMLACLLNLPQEARFITPCKLSSSFLPNYFC